MSSSIDALSETNRRMWDERVAVHRADRTGFYAVEEFRRGGDVLLPIESAEIGDVRGKRLLHLQCHFGLDTLSLVRRGALVTGLDFSAPAIDTARALAAEAGLAARFVQANLYDAPAVLPEAFDVVYSSWGALCWLHDIRRWAAIVAQFVAPGGFFYIADSHPFAMMLEQEGERLYCRYPWRSAPDEPLAFDESTTYTGDDTVFAQTKSYSWNHAFTDMLGGLIEHGLRIDFLHEHEIVPWYMFPKMTAADDRMYRMPDGCPRVPLSFSLKASKPAG